MDNNRTVLVREDDGEEFEIEPIDQSIFDNPVTAELRKVTVGQNLRIALHNPTKNIVMKVIEINDTE